MLAGYLLNKFFCFLTEKKGYRKQSAKLNEMNV